MKKLLCVLMFGLMFGQTLETRIYSIPLDFNTTGGLDIEHILLDFEQITGYDLESAVVQFYSIREWQPLETEWIDFEFRIKNVLTDGNNLAVAEYKNDVGGLSAITHYNSSFIYSKSQTLDYYLTFQTISSSTMTGNLVLEFAITSNFPNDTGVDGDLNDDDDTNILDIIVLVNLILEDDTGNIDVNGLIESVRG